MWFFNIVDTFNASATWSDGINNCIFVGKTVEIEEATVRTG